VSRGTGRTARAVGIDLGDRRIGVAVSDAGGTLAFPRPVIARGKDRGRDHEAIAGVVEEVGATVVVVGLPLSLDGGRGPSAVAAEDEAAALARLLGPRGVRVETLDERFTTVAASGAMTDAGKSARKMRTTVDSAAAAVLLQSWLDAR
jgi:putative Holliday junction resolvase